jgi:hypothetical protein
MDAAAQFLGRCEGKQPDLAVLVRLFEYVGYGEHA